MLSAANEASLWLELSRSSYFQSSQVLPLFSSLLHLVQSHFLYCPTTTIPAIAMQNLLVVVYRYYLFSMSPHHLTISFPRTHNSPPHPKAIAIISNAIICSAAAWNLPITQTTNLQLYSKSSRIAKKELSLLIDSQLSCILTLI
jgi:hypothetical protein